MLGADVAGARQIVDSVLQRGDEPGEALAYWTATYGRAVPKPVKSFVVHPPRERPAVREISGVLPGSSRMYLGWNLVHPRYICGGRRRLRCG
jgi:hypothetical protein